MNGDVKDVLRKYFSSQLLVEFSDEIDEDSDLFQLGLLDSYSYIELIRFVETEFDLQFSDEEVLDEVMTSFLGIVDLVRGKLAVRA